MSRCLSPHLNMGKAGHAVTTIHPHSDGKWWFWQDDGLIENGPFDSEALALGAYQSFTGRIGRPAVRKYDDQKTTLIGILIILIFLLIVLVNVYRIAHA
jgi:hypothetical protein